MSKLKWESPSGVDVEWIQIASMFKKNIKLGVPTVGAGNDSRPKGRFP